MNYKDKKTIVLGLDGLDAAFTQALISQGLLPAMGKLAADYGFRQILSTTPAESGVAWTCFARQVNPGQANLFDFIEREPGTYLPRLAGCRFSTQDLPWASNQRLLLMGAAAAIGAGSGAVASHRMTRRQWLKGVATAGGACGAAALSQVPASSWLPKCVETVESTIAGETWWDKLAKAGCRTVALRLPMTYPAQARPEVKLLAGLGVPDISGSQGTYRVFSEALADENATTMVWKDDRCEVKIPGPDNPVSPGKQSTAGLKITRKPGVQSLFLKTPHGTYPVEPDQWSPWVILRFYFSPLASRDGVTRFYYTFDDQTVRLYMAPVSWSPDDIPAEVPISSPPQWAHDLAQQTGIYRTHGWETQTQALSAQKLDDEAFLEDVFAVIDQNEALLDASWQRHDWDNLMLVVQATDQVSHMFFDDHIQAVCDGLAADLKHPLVRVYQRVDALVERAAAVASEKGARLVVMSDHGFSPYKKQVNLNTWLAQRGWLALKDRKQRDGDSASGVLAGEVWDNVDWFSSRAYAMGLSGIYLNVVDREPEGIVKSSGEYEFLQRRLIAELKKWHDPQTKKPVFSDVYRRQDVYDGPYADGAPDLIFGFNRGYRVSSSTVVGGIPEGELADNTSHWCADHCGIDAKLIPGVFFSNFKSNWPTQIAIADVASHLWPGVSTV